MEDDMDDDDEIGAKGRGYKVDQNRRKNVKQDDEEQEDEEENESEEEDGDFDEKDVKALER